jgi:PAS domain S-box-containing protein
LGPDRLDAFDREHKMPWYRQFTDTLARPVDLHLRAKMALLFVAASLLPLVVSAFIDIRQSRAQLLDSDKALLRAGGEQIARELDEFNRARQQSVSRIASYPETAAFCLADSARRASALSSVNALLATFPATDSAIGGAALLDRSGRILASANPASVGMDVSFRPFVRTALQGSPAISDIFLSSPQNGEKPSIAYAAPMRGSDGQVLCAAVLLVRATTFWQRIRSSDGLAGHGSFAVLFDDKGIRIAHSYNDDIVFHPAGKLEPVQIEQLVVERRFGARTRELLEDVRPFPEQFERARAVVPDREVFLGHAPVNNALNYGVARRFATVPWTLFYMLPEANVRDQIERQTLQKIALALAIIAAASILGLLFARGIVKPISALGVAAASITGGDLSARVRVESRDELGQLAGSFNTMAERVQVQAAALQHSRDELEQRVVERTAELSDALRHLRAEVAERERAESAVREGQELLQAIVDNTEALIYVKDLQGRYLMVNRRYRQLLGAGDEGIVGKTDADLLPAEAAAIIRSTDLQVAAAQAPLSAEEQVPHEDGLHTYITIKSPLRDADGVTHSVFGVSMDITDRKRAEARLQAQLERLNLLDQITCAIGERQDLQSIYQVAIRSLEERLPVDFSCVLRYDGHDSPLTVIRVGVHSAPLAMELAMPENATVPIDENGLSRCVRGHLVYEADLTNVDFPFPQRLLRGGLHSFVAAPLQSETHVFGVLIAARRQRNSFTSGECEFLRQLSAHVALAAKQAELHASLQLAYDDLRRTQQGILQQERLRALGEMASGIAHDINNAISPAALYTESLLERETGLSARGREQLKTIAMAIDDVAATIARMREFYRQREPEAVLQPVQLNDLVRHIVELTRARWHDMPQQGGAVVVMNPELASALPRIPGNEAELREALINLVFNAVDAMPAGGTLTMRTTPVAGGGSVGLEVIDTGAGMDEATRRRCLEPFFTTKGDRGTGLGLAMVYGVAQRHGAELAIESALGRGTTVRLTFPLAHETTHGASSVQPTAAPIVPLRILLVDDDPVILKTVGETLTHDGHAIAAASGGQAGIDAAHAAIESGCPFDVVITDLGMPYVDGRRVAAAMKEADPELPVIMLTGWGQRLVEDGEIPVHVNLMLAKPPKLQALRAAIAQVTGRRSRDKTRSEKGEES